VISSPRRLTVSFYSSHRTLCLPPQSARLVCDGTPQDIRTSPGTLCSFFLHFWISSHSTFLEFHFLPPVPSLRLILVFFFFNFGLTYPPHLHIPLRVFTASFFSFCLLCVKKQLPPCFSDSASTAAFNWVCDCVELPEPLWTPRRRQKPNFLANIRPRLSTSAPFKVSPSIIDRQITIFVPVLPMKS